MVKKIVLFSVILGLGALVWRYCCKSCHPPKPPSYDLNEWWGPESLKTSQDTSVKPYKVNFGDDMIKDLKYRLSNHRPWTPPLEGVAFEYGFNSGILQPILNYWRDSYDFQARQQFLNSYPQFTTNIQGLNIHFIRVKPDNVQGVQVIPLLLLHGWPGSVREFYEIIPLLTKNRPDADFVFEVIVPSLPGYGFSDPSLRPGLAPAQIGVIMRNLLHRLGHKQYYVQGGDWGSLIASTMSTLFPDEVLGHHTNMAFVQTSCSLLKTIFGSYFPSFVVEDRLADRMYPLSEHIAFAIEEFGYFHLQATKPDTIGVALTDSPAGLAAYILEKFTTWTSVEYRKRPDGGLTERFTLDQLLDNLMMYWISNSITTSMRLYAEAMTNENRAVDWNSIPTPVPTWIIQAKYELFYQPPSFFKAKYPNLLGITVLEEGGHFLAFELPKVLAEDIYKAVKAFRAWHRDNKEKGAKTEF